MGFEGEEEEEEEEEEEAEDLMITLVQTVKEGKKPTSFPYKSLGDNVLFVSCWPNLSAMFVLS